MWERYLDGQGVNEPSHRHNADEMGTSCTFRTVTPEPDVTDQKCEKPAWNGHCDGVTVEKGENGFDGGNEAWPRVCDHCGGPEKPGKPVRECWVAGEQIWLHQDCQANWLAAPDPNGFSFNLDGGP
jgi:hypothetical protein